MASSQDAVDAQDDDELTADEPRTPLWLPLVGLALFMAALLVFVGTGSEGKTAEELSEQSVRGASPPAAAEPTPEQPPQPKEKPSERGQPSQQPAPRPNPPPPSGG